MTGGPLPAAAPPCVVHLVRAVNGLAPLERFAAAWRRHRPGVAFTFVLALKGFASEAQARPHLELTRELDPQPRFFPDTGLDLGVYFQTARALEAERYCFLNSFSEPLVDGWLAKLDDALRGPGTGLVGATGSWGSIRSWTLYSLGLPTVYAGAMPDRRVARRHLSGLGAEHAARAAGDGTQPPPTRSRPGRALARARLRALAEIPEQVYAYEPFPAPHLRTNAMMVSRATLERLHLASVTTKREAYRVESGRRSLTRQVRALGLRTLVVDRDGTGHEPEDWHRASTFWRAEQDGLLVADNQTRAYADGGLERRRVLSGFAWGAQADPGAGAP